MEKLITRIVVNIAAFYAAAALFPAINLFSPLAVLGAAVILTLINFTLRPVLFIVTLPLNLLTLGLFTFIMNTWMVMLADLFIPGLTVPGFWPALGTALIISALNMTVKALRHQS
ncbi:phage holin family protein [Candidatus Formimonas warabiya]|uniref:Phage holin family protein n=1 Tax=Formimonas warabiya TaxID=1761012 RepID=A0A3G1KWV4_FORW1|nr:phage holin family protein [Candidatus Formimonas warabiya]ATW26900.1 hypothetical protein DCMF_20960 [Candidatus Formimonas warabiya]